MPRRARPSSLLCTLSGKDDEGRGWRVGGVWAGREVQAAGDSETGTERREERREREAQRLNDTNHRLTSAKKRVFWHCCLQTLVTIQLTC